MDVEILLQLADGWLARGAKLLWIDVVSKAPAIPGEHGFHDATNDKDQLVGKLGRVRRGTALGLGIVPGSVGCVVLDVDDKNGKNGSITLGEWEQEHEKLTPTAISRTPSGGFHIWYEKDEEVGNYDLVPGVNVRGDRGYVGLPGVERPDGTRYQWMEGKEWDKLSAWPEALKRELGGKAGSRTFLDFNLDDPRLPAETRKTVERWLELGGHSGRMMMRTHAETREQRVCVELRRPNKYSGVGVSIGYEGDEFGKVMTDGWVLPNGRIFPMGWRGSLDELENFVAYGKNEPTLVDKKANARHTHVLDRVAYHGIAGQLVDLVVPHGEAHPAGILVNFLAGWGCIIGTRPRLVLGPDVYYPNLFAVNVGRTAKGRKTSTWRRARKLLKEADPTFFETVREQSGYGSGQALIDDVADVKITIGDKVAYEPDRRLLIVEDEFDAIIKVTQNKESKFSAILRAAFDKTGPLQAKARTAAGTGVATEHHIGIVAGITLTELSRSLDQNQIHNGLANRILWVSVERQGSVPIPTWPEESALRPLLNILRERTEKAKATDEVTLTEEAKQLWITELYEALESDDPADTLGAVIERGAVMTLRMALIYALLDGKDQIGVEHLEAAHAVWRYCRASAAFIWGEGVPGEAPTVSIDPKDVEMTEKILRSVGDGGIKRTALKNGCSSRTNVDRFERCLEDLIKAGKLTTVMKVVNYNNVEFILKGE